MTGPRSPGDTLDTLNNEVVFVVQVLKDGSTKYLKADDLIKGVGAGKAAAQAEAKASRAEKAIKELVVPATQHFADKDNPHGVTKDHLGLDQVENLGPLPIGPKADGLATSGDVYDFTTQNFLPKDAIFPAQSVVLGREAGWYGGTLGASVLIGARAGRAGLAEFHDYVAIGADTHPLASRTVSLGHTRDIFTASKDVVVRADKRDFKVVGDLDLGLDFILKLKPVLAQMDLREDYVDYKSMPLPPDDRALPPTMPRGDDRNPIYHKEWVAYREAMLDWQKNIDEPYQAALAKWRREWREWQKTNRLAAMKPDGTHRSSDIHAMLLADDAADAADILKSVFTGVIDFKQLGGLDVKGLRTGEMIPVLVKGIQDIFDYVHSDGFVDRVVGAMLAKGTRGTQALRHAANAHRNQQREDDHAAAVAAGAVSQDSKD